jgi:hypothetical protein
VFALRRPLPGSDREKDAEILALRHQLIVQQRQLDGQPVGFRPADQAWLAALLHCLPGARKGQAAAAGSARHDPSPAP